MLGRLIPDSEVLDSKMWRVFRGSFRPLTFKEGESHEEQKAALFLVGLTWRRRGSRRNKVNCHQCLSDRQGATSTARMPGAENPSLCKQGQLPHSNKQTKEESQGITSARRSQSSSEILQANSQLVILPSHPTVVVNMLFLCRPCVTGYSRHENKNPQNCNDSFSSLRSVSAQVRCHQ